MEDVKVGLLLRALRRRKGLRQLDLAMAAGVSQPTISRVERGHIDRLSMATLRRVIAAVEARLELDVRWRGGASDRLIDEDHSALVSEAARVLRTSGWTVLTEITFSIYGERGSIDLLGLRPASRSAVIYEAKTEITSWEETQRRFDIKVRLLHGIVLERVGWRPRNVGRVLLLRESMTNRRRMAGVGQRATDAFPARANQIRAWLRRPAGDLAGLWFLSVMPYRSATQTGGGRHRVRRPHLSPGQGGQPARMRSGLKGNPLS